MIRPTTFWCTLWCALLTFSASATIIIPFENLGHLTEESSEVVVATVTHDHFYDSDQMITYSWSLEVNRAFKNQIQEGETIRIDGMSSKSQTQFNLVLADIKLEVGKTYLIFLDKNELTGRWKPRTMSMYVYEIMFQNGKPYYVPTLNALESCKWGDEEEQFVMELSKFNNYLQAFIDNNYQASWNEEKIKTSLAIDEFHPILKAPPSHCSFLFDGASGCGVTYDGVRWQVFPDDPVEVHIDFEEQYNDSDQEVSDAISDMTFEYEGVNLTDEGVVSSSDNFTPDCVFGKVSSSGNFNSYCSGLNSGDNILVVFNDPCSEITDLTGCSGTLAIGGLFGSCPSTDDFDGGDWLLASNGYVVVNDDVESCLNLDEFKIMMTHELTHALGIGHIPSGNGAANMNPSCCNDIATLDVDCMEYLYPASIVPVKWNDISATEEKDHNLISWSTSVEVNNDFFQVEYSENGIDFIRLSKVEGAGDATSLQEYFYEDYHFQSSTAYYRIKQVDFDGNYEYSEIVVVQRNDTKENIKLFPNPARDELFVSNLKTNSSYKIVDVLGNLHELKINNSNASYTNLDIADLSSGLYYIEIKDNAITQTMSFIKL